MKFGRKALLLVFAAAALNCAPKKTGTASSSASRAELLMIDFSFMGESEDQTRYAISVVDPWALAQGEYWRCDVTSGHLRSVVALKRTGPNEFLWVTGMGVGAKIEMFGESAVFMKNDTTFTVALSEPARKISAVMISKEAAKELEETLKESGGELTVCVKEAEEKTPKKEPAPDPKNSE